jgi:hypothetical protein
MLRLIIHVYPHIQFDLAKSLELNNTLHTHEFTASLCQDINKQTNKQTVLTSAVVPMPQCLFYTVSLCEEETRSLYKVKYYSRMLTGLINELSGSSSREFNVAGT